MKIYVQAVLLLLLVSLLYVKPTYIKHIKDSVLGKLALLAMLIFITHTYGLETGIIMALIYVFLLHTSHEGMDHDGKKEEEEKEGEDEEKPEEEEKEGEDEEKPEVVEKHDQQIVEEALRKPASGKDEAPESAREETEEPVAVGSKMGAKDKKEGFSLLY